MASSIKESEVTNRPLLTEEDIKRIMEEEELDCHTEILQDSHLRSQETFTDETKVLDLILEEEDSLRDDILKQDFHKLCEFLENGCDHGIGTVSNYEVTSCNDPIMKDIDRYSTSTDEESNLCTLSENDKEEVVRRTKTKGELKELYNEQDTIYRSRSMEITHSRRKPHNRKVKPGMQPSADFHDECQFKAMNLKCFGIFSVNAGITQIPKNSYVIELDKMKLDEFLMKLLDDDHFSSFIHWTYKDGKEFKLVNAGQVSNLWGKLRGKKKFTTDKLLREMRHLRSNGLMHKLERKDHYKFS